MSKLRLFAMHFTPLCLKLRGRIVGAVSRMTMTIYIATGLLVVSSILLFLVFFGLKSYPNSAILLDKNTDIKADQPVENQPAVIAVSPQAPPTPERKAIDSQPSQEVLVISKTIRSPIKVDFGWQLHDVYKDWRYHTGIDISGPVGQSVEALYKGQVTDIFRDTHSGLTVVVKGSTYTIHYGSLSAVKVDKGSFISAGQLIGSMGSCDAEPYNHLHLGIKKGDKYMDPKLIINQ